MGHDIVGEDAAAQVTPLEPFGAVVEGDARLLRSAAAGTWLRALIDTHKLLVFRGQTLGEADQVTLLGHFGKVLGSRGEHREISSDGNLGAGALAFHSDLAFTAEPFKFLSLHALEVNDGQSWTRFANGIAAAARIPADLRAVIEGRAAVTAISLVQTHRAVGYDVPDDLPQQRWPVVMPHPRTGEPLLYVSEMQTARIEGLDRAASDAALERLFALLYAAEHVYEHRWRNGDLVVWDNIALQHARCDLTGMHPRRLQRVAVADKSFYDLLPQFAIGDARIRAWGQGAKLEIDPVA